MTRRYPRSSGSIATVHIVDVSRRPEGDLDALGLWWSPIYTGTKRTAWLQCPFGHRMALEHYEIESTGFILTPVACEAIGCGFTELLHLIGWSPVTAS
jgi:hypothetical protein